MNSRIVRGGAAVAALVLAGITLSTPAFAADDAKLSVVHGIPGVTVDVQGQFKVRGQAEDLSLGFYLWF